MAEALLVIAGLLLLWWLVIWSAARDEASLNAERMRAAERLWEAHGHPGQRCTTCRAGAPRD